MPPPVDGDVPNGACALCLGGPSTRDGQLRFIKAGWSVNAAGLKYRLPRTCACKRSFSSRSLSKITADCSWRSWTTPFTLLRRVVKEDGTRQSVSRQGPARWEK